MLSGYIIYEEDLILKDVIVVTRWKAKLWCCNEVQELVKTMMTWCIDNLLDVTKASYTKKV